MTRLTCDDIRDIPDTLKTYDRALLRKTGVDLIGIACRAWGTDESGFADTAGDTRVAVIPISWGLGAIPGFSDTVQKIARHMGFKAFVTRSHNVAGLCEAAERRADVILLSDDDLFAAIHVRTGKRIDNSTATGKVFAVGLELMSDGLAGREVLVVGCGPVGRSAARTLLQLGAELSVMDIDGQKARDVARAAELESNRSVRVEATLHEALLKHRYILDASPAAEIVKTIHLTGGTLISAPGVPLGLTAGALQKMTGRVLHDPLQLGVAAMLAAVVKA